MSDAATWFEARTQGSPPALLKRVTECLATAGTFEPLAQRLAVAGEQALGASIRRGTGREAALDLLAADALITLALLETASRAPAELGPTARRLRNAAVGAA